MPTLAPSSPSPSAVSFQGILAPEDLSAQPLFPMPTHQRCQGGGLLCSPRIWQFLLPLALPPIFQVPSQAGPPVLRCHIGLYPSQASMQQRKRYFVLKVKQYLSPSLHHTFIEMLRSIPDLQKFLELMQFSFHSLLSP